MENELKKLNATIKADELILMDVLQNKIAGRYTAKDSGEKHLDLFMKNVKLPSFLTNIKSLWIKNAEANLDFKFPWGYVYIKHINAEHLLLLSFPTSRICTSKINAYLNLFSPENENQ